MRPTEIISNGLISDKAISSGPSDTNQKPSSQSKSLDSKLKQTGFLPSGFIEQKNYSSKIYFDVSSSSQSSPSSNSNQSRSWEDNFSSDNAIIQERGVLSSVSTEEKEKRNLGLISEEVSNSTGYSESMVEDSNINDDPTQSLDDISEFTSGFNFPSGDDKEKVGLVSSKSSVDNQIRTQCNPDPKHVPISTPSADYFAQALEDKEKEAVVTQYMKDRYLPAIEMIKAVNDVSGIGGDIDDIIRMLIRSAIKKPEVFNFECRAAVLVV
ncbi:hypothetical protein C5167_038705 [Papaver somniferum]|uniref:Uncharacterized protein n=1 Tax=Papaver somniferum TaxID=3469 RepID=A0A4Y7IDA0_PAPSO|nr:uncharacterized protein LOC113332416 [Papaver somniferum]RZC45760.1 hypothetical protein C5167_038705 [Papaver somniferum]